MFFSISEGDLTSFKRIVNKADFDVNQISGVYLIFIVFYFIFWIDAINVCFLRGKSRNG